MTYWATIQRAFDLDRTMINLNNGGCSPAPTHVLEQMIRDLRFSNELPETHDALWRQILARLELDQPKPPAPAPEASPPRSNGD